MSFLTRMAPGIATWTGRLVNDSLWSPTVREVKMSSDETRQAPWRAHL